MIRPKVLETAVELRAGSAWILLSDGVKSIWYPDPSRLTTDSSPSLDIF